MRAKFHNWAQLLLLAGLLAGGCATASRPSADHVKWDTIEKSQRFTPKEEDRIQAHAHFATGMSYDLQGEQDKALEEFFQAAMLDPGSELLVQDVVRRLIRKNDFQRAAQLLEKAIDQPKASGMLHALHAVVLAQAGKLEQAVAANRKAIQKSPELLQPYQNLVKIYLDADKPAEAVKVLDQAAKNPPDDSLYLVELAELYILLSRHHSQAGQWETFKPKVVQLLEKAEALKPSNPIVLQRMADQFRIVGMFEKASVIYVDLLKQFPEFPGLRERLIDVYIRSGDRDSAREQLEAVVRRNPASPQAYIFLSAIAVEDKELEKAADYLEKAILFEPKFDAAVYYDLAGLQININKPRKALDTLEKAQKLHPKRFISEYFAGLAYNQLKDYEKALQHFTEAEVLAGASEPERLTHVFYFQVGAVLERLKDYDRSADYFKKALAKSPDFADALNYLGYMWADLGINLQEAKTMIERAVKIEPDNAAFLDSLGWVLFKLNKPREALPHIRKAIELSEEPDATLYDHLGDIFSELGQTGEAREAWKKSIQIEPNEQIQKKLDEARPEVNTVP